MTDVARADAPAATALVVGGSPERPSPALLRRLAAGAGLVVACDGGADACRAAGVMPDMLVGDEDSLEPASLRYVREGGCREVRFPMDKDEVDLSLAVRFVRRERPGVTRLVLTGVSGGRLDHGLAVIGIALRAADLGVRVEEDAFAARVLDARTPGAPREVAFGTKDLGRTVSVIAAPGEASVTEWGMRWGVRGLALRPLGGEGVSNVVEAMPAGVRVERGRLLVIVQRERIAKAVTTVA